MPSLNFVMPHWLYWSALALFPLIAIWLVHRERRRPWAGRPNLFLGYLFLVTAGFIGMHRFYLKSGWGFLMIPFFLAVLWTAADVRDAREDLSLARSIAERAERYLPRAQADVDKGREGAEEKLAKAKADAAEADGNKAAATAGLVRANRYAHAAGALLGILLLIEAFLLPGLVRRARASEPPPAAAAEDHVLETAVPATPVKQPLPFFRPVDWLARVTGELVAYWAVLAVFVYYYEVVARYIFNSPTNWVHESMFLMFGMQYMVAGAYAYRDETHVRVDIVYSHLSERARAVCDIITSAFFFLFVGTMVVSGWRFASDAMSVGETSFTEWGVQYWPVKLAIPIGAALLLLQGISRLARDITVAFGKAR
ncbi:MAG: TRAP transporter small permease subunit [Parvibaculaceae bacterium]